MKQPLAYKQTNDKYSNTNKAWPPYLLSPFVVFVPVLGDSETI